MAAGPPRFPREHFTRFDHNNLGPGADQLVGGRYTRNSGTNDADIGADVLGKLLKFRTTRVGLGVDPDGLCLAGGIQEVLWAHQGSHACSFKKVWSWTK